MIVLLGFFWGGEVVDDDVDDALCLYSTASGVLFWVGWWLVWSLK